MPWADALWTVTYNSHKKGTGYGLGLYRIDEGLKSERVHVHDGTHANRMIHKNPISASLAHTWSMRKETGSTFRSSMGFG
jgi:hypothetical protein